MCGGGGAGAEFIPQSHTLPDPLFPVILRPQGFTNRPGWQASLFSGLQMLNTIYSGGKKKKKEKLTHSRLACTHAHTSSEAR